MNPYTWHKLQPNLQSEQFKEQFYLDVIFVDYVSEAVAMVIHTVGEGDVSISFNVAGISRVEVSFVVVGDDSQSMSVRTALSFFFLVC